MKAKIENLLIERFRGLRKISINGLGRVNLITGRNNNGKSTVLEAIRLLASDASPSVLLSILVSREEGTEEMDDQTRPVDLGSGFQLSSLFQGFPEFSAHIEPIVIESSGGQNPMRLSIGMGWFSEERGSNGVRRLLTHQGNLFGEDDSLPGLVIEAGNTQRIQPLDTLRKYLFRSRSFRSEPAEESRFPCIFVSPYGGERTATLGTLWDKIALSDLEKDIVEALRIISPGISAVSMIGGEPPRRARTAIVKSVGFPRPVPLRSFGDGLNRLFGIILSLVNAKDGLLLIDEFENGLHYSIQADAWRAIFRLAKNLDIQVMATSHSWDAIEAFQKVAGEESDDGVLIRLSHKGEDIIPTRFGKSELAVASRDRIEVR